MKQVGRRKTNVTYIWNVKKKDKNSSSDFPGGPVDKNPPANAGNTGSIPGTGRSHPPQDNETHTAQLLSLPSRARAPHLEKP